MKNLNFKWTAVVAIAVIFGAVVLTSCSKNQPVLETRNLDRQETIFLFPEGTRSIPSKTADNEMDFILPKGYEFITFNPDQTRMLSITNGGTITCDCSSGDGGCKPFSAKGNMGCFTEGCKTCVGTLSNSNSFASTLNFIKVPILSNTGAMISLSGLGDYGCIINALDWVSAPYISSSDFNPQINKKLDELLESAWEKPIDEIRLDDRAVYTPMHINEYKFLMAIPFERLEEGMLFIPKKAIYVNSSATCSGCSGACTLVSKSFGAVVFCDGCDSGCTLSTESSDNRIRI